MQQNEEASVKYCQSILDQISKPLMESISAGTFSAPGGHKLYRQAKESIEWDYSQVPRKGVKVSNRGAWGAYRIASKGSSDNLRAMHQLWMIRRTHMGIS